MPTAPILAAFWTINGSSSQISILSGGNQATGVNNYAEAVGGGYDQNGEYRGMYWASPTALPTVLSPLAGGLQSLAVDINDEGVICGYSLQSNAVARRTARRRSPNSACPNIV